MENNLIVTGEYAKANGRGVFDGIDGYLMKSMLPFPMSW